MPMNINILQENLQRLEDLNAVMELMSQIDRVPVSKACQELADHMKTTPDPLLYTAQAVESPYMKKAKAKKRCLCF